MRAEVEEMELTFLGTRGDTAVRSRRHWRHSALLVEQGDARIMIDCGADWLHRLRIVAPTAIVLTHAHEDHAAGLAEGAPCPVYATEATWKSLRHLPVAEKRVIPLRNRMRIGGVRFFAVPVQHSIRAPAVGYRVSGQDCCLFYLPDVAELPTPSQALWRVDLYIGDGATVRRSMVRRKGRALVGHAPIVCQLDWCKKARVRHAIFTHCGSPIVRASAHAMDLAIAQLGREHGMDVRIARDGEWLSLHPVGHTKVVGARARPGKAPGTPEAHSSQKARVRRRAEVTGVN
jgi:phosphoribosyl 1,2-cyclic phosphodiesterase